MTEPAVVLNDPNVGTDRAQLQAAADAREQAAAALRAQIPQVRAVYPKLKARTATNAEIQGVLAFMLRWMQVQETD